MDETAFVFADINKMVVVKRGETHILLVCRNKYDPVYMVVYMCEHSRRLFSPNTYCEEYIKYVHCTHEKYMIQDMYFHTGLQERCILSGYHFPLKIPA